MKILNASVLEDLKRGQPLQLNLGSGQRQIPGFYNVDHLPLENVDIVADLNQPLASLPDNSVSKIYTRHTLEHIQQFMELIAELHRVTMPGGTIDIIVPHFSNPYGYSDPTHVRFFGLYSFYYFADPKDQPRRKVPSFYVPQRFQIQQIRIQLLKETILDKVARTLLQPLINRNVSWLDWYERRLCRMLPANDIHFTLTPIKQAASEQPLARAA